MLAMGGGRPRADFDKHKDLIIELYTSKTPWPKIEQILLAEHGCRAQARTIMRRFKEWNVEFRRVATDRNDHLRARIQEYWADRATRPKSDEDLHQKLKADGFKVSMGAIPRLRREMNLFRRWDEKLGRVRPDSELGRRKRRKQKYSAFTSAQLVPPPDRADDLQHQLDEPEYAPLDEAADESDAAYFDAHEPGQAHRTLASPLDESHTGHFDPSHFDADHFSVHESEQIPPTEGILIPAHETPAPAADKVRKKRGRPRLRPAPDESVERQKPRRVNEQPLTILYAKKAA